MRHSLIALMLAIGVSSASAQEVANVAPGQIGLVTAQDGMLVPLSADAGISGINKKEAGTACKLQPGDTFEVVTITADGLVLVKRKFHFRPTAPDKDTCPRGALVTLGKPVAVAAVQAKLAADAVKAADKSK